MRFSIRLLIIVAFTLLVSSPKLVDKGLADGGPNHRVRNLNFGVSGGNVNDATQRFCCSGTLGALLRDTDNTLYVLSNNHVLGLTDNASPGQDISQPGLIDNNCQIPTIVADFTLAPQLEPSNVDAAIAQLRPGTMDSTGFIADIGVPSSVVAPPAVGLGVAKSGRTTGFTTGTISSINTTVNVQYQQGCGKGKKFTVNYTNQVVINSSTFSAGGDSGSLIVTQNTSQPVALLFAGSSTTTIGSPIGEVLTRLSAALGKTVSFVGTTQAASMDTLAQQVELGYADEVRKRHEGAFMSRQGVFGMGIGRSATSEPVIVLYVDPTAGPAHAHLPGDLDGVRVQVFRTERFKAF